MSSEPHQKNQPGLFSDWFDSFYASYYRHRPVNATFIGVHDYDGRLPDCSENGLEALQAETVALRLDLDGFPHETLSRSQRLDRELAAGFLDIQEWELSSGHFQRGNPAYYTGEIVFGVMSLFLRAFTTLEERVESAIDRLEAIPALLHQGRNNVPSAPHEWTERAIRDCAGADRFFQSGIDSLIRDTGLDHRLRTAADGAVQAVGEHRKHLSNELLHGTSTAYACGEAAFDLLMRRGHFLDMSATDILRHAEEQASESEARLNEGASGFGASSWQEALKRLAGVHPLAIGYYQRYSEFWDACRSTAEAQKLLTWPDYPIQYVPRPKWSRDAAPHLYFLFYRSPAPYDNVPIVDYLVTPIEPDMPQAEQERLLRANNDSVIKLNHVVHHGSIGHHVQNWHAFRAESRIGQMAAVDCASRIAMFCGGTMAEGWACYATDLMREAGFLTPLERYSQHHARLRMAVRAIVDVRLHRGEFTINEAATYYQQRVGMPPGVAMDEAVKNSMFPGAATIYLIGADLIHELRRDLSVLQGSQFSLCAFHDRLLSYGSVPVQLISTQMRKDAACAE
jgi:hypothetical protein